MGSAQSERNLGFVDVGLLRSKCAADRYYVLARSIIRISLTLQDSARSAAQRLFLSFKCAKPGNEDSKHFTSILLSKEIF